MKKYVLILVLLLAGTMLFAKPEKVTNETFISSFTNLVERFNGTIQNVYACYDITEVQSLVNSDMDTWENIITMPNEEYHETMYPIFVAIYQDNDEPKYYGIIYYFEGYKTHILRAPL